MQKRVIPLLAGAMFLVCATAGLAAAGATELSIGQSFKIDSQPVDTALSADGKFFYVLSDSGAVHIYSGEGEKVDTVQVGKSIRKIEASQDGSRLYLADSTDNSIKVADLSFTSNFDYAGSPVKGPAGAPVTLAVFSDFQ